MLGEGRGKQHNMHCRLEPEVIPYVISRKIYLQFLVGKGTGCFWALQHALFLETYSASSATFRARFEWPQKYGNTLWYLHQWEKNELCIWWLSFYHHCGNFLASRTHSCLYRINSDGRKEGRYVTPRTLLNLPMLQLHALREIWLCWGFVWQCFECSDDICRIFPSYWKN